MFAALARFSEKYKIWIILFWGGLAIALMLLSPSLSEVGVTDDAQFLPKDTQSTLAQRLLETRFAGSAAAPAGSALIVVHDSQGLSPRDKEIASDLHDWLLSEEAPDIIHGVISVFDTPALSSTLISQDQTTMLMSLEMSAASSSASARQAVQEIRSKIQSLPNGPQILVSGSAGVSADVLTSIQETIDKATLVTIILVIVLLLLIYRSPIAILVPLITIGASYLVARGVTGYIAATGVNVSSLVDAYLVVTLFGIGTDYCLFMVSRFKEELLVNDRQMAGRMTLQRIGPVILASATTVVVALLCLGISQFGMNRTSGYMLAIGVAITLIAGLTLTPALISLFGEKLLWPSKLRRTQRSTRSLWNRIGEMIIRRPVVLAVPILVVLAVPYLALPQMNFSSSLFDQMPEDMGSVQGYNITRSHFPAGEFYPLSLLIESDSGDLYSADSLQSIGRIAASLSLIEGVSRVDYFAAPADQLMQWSRQSQSISSSLSAATLNQLSFFQTLSQNLQALAIRYPGILQSPNFQQISTVLRQFQSAALSPQSLAGQISQLQQGASAVASGLNGLAGEFSLQVDSPFSRSLKSTFFSTDNKIVKIQITLATDPYSRESMNSVREIREAAGQALSDSSLPGATFYLGGTSAAQSDILEINDTDFLRVLALSIAGILLVTMFLLRSILAPVYMILTVLFNFGATLGIATWLYLDVLQQNTIIYMLPIFVFVILIAVGSDYNIFLVSRIREEFHQRSLQDAIGHSVANTGGVITSCGIILAGTFATLTSASLQMVFQVGAAIAVGVLIDTFLIRAIVIPALAKMAGRWSWWPSSLYRRK